jgi:hypothetical protein
MNDQRRPTTAQDDIKPTTTRTLSLFDIGQPLVAGNHQSALGEVPATTAQHRNSETLVKQRPQQQENGSTVNGSGETASARHAVSNVDNRMQAPSSLMTSRAHGAPCAVLHAGERSVAVADSFRNTSVENFGSYVQCLV